MADHDNAGDRSPGMPAEPERRAGNEDRPGRRHGKRRRSRKSAVALIVGLLVVVIAGGLAIAGLVIQSQIKGEIDYFEDPFEELTERPNSAEGEEGEADPLNFLVLGSDSRISAGDPTQWEFGAQRTDAILLVHLPGDRQSAQVMSIPRDSWVEIPGYGTNKINAAFSFGGPPLMIQTVEQLTGVHIDHFAVTDFEAFAALTDELGGVEITLPDGLNQGGVQLEPGTHLLNGEQALAYVRQRYGLSGGDFDRVQRQQNWMRAILKAAFDNDVLTNPGKLVSFLRTVASSVAVDEGFEIEQMRTLALSLRDIRPGDLTFMTVPVAGTDTSSDGQSIVVLDQEPFDALMAAVAADDEVAQYIKDHPELTTLGSDVS
ncbi:LCP family protein [Pseudactinotalea terrae]|uniref:LCP family protein n=1 Tax=Pseudactinotalea terrae TaxID=1743262 RepID=UPI001F4FFAB4|nr:LCP family protein [Pseudactinotalea terrae]